MALKLFCNQYRLCSRAHSALYYAVHSKQSIKSEAPPHVPSQCHGAARVRHLPAEWSPVCVFSQWCCGRGRLLRSSACVGLLLPFAAAAAAARTAAALLTMSRPSADSIWSDLRKRTGTITLFSFFRWVPSERRKEGRGEEVNKPSAFLQRNKETLDRHLHFSMKQGFVHALLQKDEKSNSDVGQEPFFICALLDIVI